MLQMERRAVARCPPYPPLPYGPVCVRTGPSLSFPSEPHTHRQVEVEVKGEGKTEVKKEEYG